MKRSSYVHGGMADGKLDDRRLVRINVGYVLAVGLYGFAIDEPYWREVGHGPSLYDALLWLGLLLNGPSGLLAEWLAASVAGPGDFNLRFGLLYLLWIVFLWGQWRLYFLVTVWSAGSAARARALDLGAVIFALLGAAAAYEAWSIGHRPSDCHVDPYFWFVRVVGVASSGLVLVMCRRFVCSAPAQRTDIV